MAENIKKKIGTVINRPVEIAMIAKGRNVFTGLPESFEITSTEVFEAIKEPVTIICKAIKSVLMKTDPDLVADINIDGLYLSGGGSLINGMDVLLSEYIGVKVHHLSDPLHSVVKGAAFALKHTDLLKNADYQLRSIKELIIE